MPRIVRLSVLLPVIFLMHWALAEDDPFICRRVLVPQPNPRIIQLKKDAVKLTLNGLAYAKGLPKHMEGIKEFRDSGRYLDYANFGEMGLAELGISVRYDQAYLNAMNTGRPLIIVANHHLGIADGLAMQYLVSKARTDAPSLLFLARWIQDLLPHAVYDDETGWGTALPIEINKPKESDPDFIDKLARMKEFNGKGAETALKVLRMGGALIVFPAGHVAGMNAGAKYPANVYDEVNSWQSGFIQLARRAKADIVFANVDSVNSKAFYKYRKLFGGGDYERIIWFFSEAIAKKGKFIDVHFSKPMAVDEIYDNLSTQHPYSREELKKNADLTAELMRQFSYDVSKQFPQLLDTPDSPKKLQLVDPLGGAKVR